MNEKEFTSYPFPLKKESPFVWNSRRPVKVHSTYSDKSTRSTLVLYRKAVDGSYSSETSTVRSNSLFGEMWLKLGTTPLGISSSVPQGYKESF